MIEVALTDDEPLFTAGLEMVIDAQPDMRVAWTAESGVDALAHHAAEEADVLLLDIRMRGIDGLETTRRLIDSDARTRVVILTTFSADEYVLAAIEAGAAGFLLKSTPPEGLLAAIRTVHRGDSVISPGPTRQLFGAFRGGAAGPVRSANGRDRETLESLTAREREILSLVGDGCSNQEICDRLWLSMSTVKSHVSALMGKVGARDRVQLVLFALRTGLAAV